MISLCCYTAAHVILSGAASKCPRVTEEVFDFSSIQKVNTHHQYKHVSWQTRVFHVHSGRLIFLFSKRSNSFVLQADACRAAARPRLLRRLRPLHALPKTCEPLLFLAALCTSGTPRRHQRPLQR